VPLLNPMSVQLVGDVITHATVDDPTVFLTA
jgi:hypothetical protein